MGVLGFVADVVVFGFVEEKGGCGGSDGDGDGCEVGGRWLSW